MNCVRVPSYLLVVFVLDSGIEYYDAFDDNSTLEPILTNTYNGGIILHLDADLNDLTIFTFRSRPDNIPSPRRKIRKYSTSSSVYERSVVF